MTTEAREPLPNQDPAAPRAGAIADGVERKLDPRHVALSKTIGWIVTLGFAVPGLGVSAGLIFSPDLPAWASAAIVAAIGGTLAFVAWLGQTWPAREHRFTAYRLDEAGLEIRRGVWWRSVANVPRSRVQHTDVSQGPIERRYGLGTLHIFTAGTDHAEMTLAGLDHDIALRIRDDLLSGGGHDAV